MELKLDHLFKNTDISELISHFKINPSFQEEVVNYALSNNNTYSWKAAWLLGRCLDEHKPFLKKHLPRILSNISDKRDGHQRELIKILLELDLNEEQEGILYDHCAKIWQQRNNKPSVRFAAFKYLCKTAKKYPGLFTELRLLAQPMYLKTLSPGIRKSVIKMIEKK